jgi:hypothetical protein
VLLRIKKVKTSLRAQKQNLGSKTRMEPDVQEKLLREELIGEELFGVSVSHSVSFISHLEQRAAQKLGRFVDVQYLSFLLNHVTEKMDI